MHPRMITHRVLSQYFLEEAFHRLEAVLVALEAVDLAARMEPVYLVPEDHRTSIRFKTRIKVLEVFQMDRINGIPS